MGGFVAGGIVRIGSHVRERTPVRSLPRHGVSSTYGIVYDTDIVVPRIVIDTNVLVSAVRSRRGASFRLLSLVGGKEFEITVSVPLTFEYEDALMRIVPGILAASDVRDLLDYLCEVADKRRVFYLWRPVLSDPRDDHVLEAAVAGGCDAIVTFDRRHFAGAERFGVRVMGPKEFLIDVGELK